MNLQTVVDDVKCRVEGFTNQSQKVAQVSMSTLKQANEVVTGNVRSMLKGNTNVAWDLFTSTRSGFEKARADGVKAVVTDPVSYLPAHDKVLSAFKDNRKIVAKTGDDLMKLVKEGFSALNGEIEDVAPAVKKSVSKARSTARKTATKATRKVRSAAK